MKTPVTNVTCWRWLLPLAGALGLTATTALAASYSETVLADGPVAYYRFEEPANAMDITNAVNPDLYAGLATFDDFSAYPKFAQAGITVSQYYR